MPVALQMVLQIAARNIGQLTDIEPPPPPLPRIAPGLAGDIRRQLTDTLGIAESRAGFDAQLILDAARRSIRLWPENGG